MKEAAVREIGSPGSEYTAQPRWLAKHYLPRRTNHLVRSN